MLRWIIIGAYTGITIGFLSCQSNSQDKIARNNQYRVVQSKSEDTKKADIDRNVINKPLIWIINKTSSPGEKVRFWSEVPEVIIYDDGRVFKRIYDEDMGHPVWRRGQISGEDIAALIKKLEELNIIEICSNTKLQKKLVSCKRLPLHLTTTVIGIRTIDGVISFSCYGFKTIDIPEISNLKKAIDILHNVKADKKWIPERITLLIGGGQKNSFPQFEAIPWPFSEILLQQNISQQDSLFWKKDVSGSILPQLVRIMKRNSCFVQQGYRYVISYRPVFPDWE
jgi:hypothetical protein